MNEPQQEAEWNVVEWHGKTLVDVNGEKIGKLSRMSTWTSRATCRSSRPSRRA